MLITSRSKTFFAKRKRAKGPMAVTITIGSYKAHCLNRLVGHVRQIRMDPLHSNLTT